MTIRQIIKDKKLKELVIARLEVLPANKKISIGSTGEFTKDELIEQVEKESSIGEKIIEIELEYLQALKKGLFNE